MAVAAPVAFVTEMVPLSSLRPNPKNPRRIKPSELDNLVRSLRKYGFVQPLVVRRENRTIVGGNQRLIAATRIGYTEGPVFWVDLPEPEAEVLGLALNRISGEWDDDLLARLLSDVADQSDIDLTLSGFGADEMKALLRRLDADARRDQPESFDLDSAVAEATRQQRTKSGDLWILGNHRLLCGDATRQADIAKVLDGGKAAMTFTDPPYNVAYGANVNPRWKKRSISNDDMTAEAWSTFVRGWAEQLLASTDGALYICMSGKEWPVVSAVLNELGAHWSTTIIWAKDRFVLGRADYQREYEPIWYGWREGGDHFWVGDRDQGDVWQIQRPGNSPLHPTMKPLALMERALNNSSKPGDVVLDPFGGSGSTLIAAERTGRRCAMVELDPIYVDVIVNRWTRFSGMTADKA